MSHFMRLLHLCHLQACLSHHSRHDASPYGSPETGWRLPSQVTCQESITHLKGGGEGLLTIRCNSWFWIICPSGFRFFLASSLLSPGGAEVLPSWFLSFSVSHLHLFSLALSFSIVPICLFLFSSFHHSFFLSLSILFPFSIFNSFYLSSTFSPFGFVLHLSALVFPLFQSFCFWSH